MSDELKPIVTAEMLMKELKFVQLESGDTQATLKLQAVYDDQEVHKQLKELADKKFIVVVIMENNK
jgi:hypothetical protein